VNNFCLQFPQIAFTANVLCFQKFWLVGCLMTEFLLWHFFSLRREFFFVFLLDFIFILLLWSVYIYIYIYIYIYVYCSCCGLVHVFDLFKFKIMGRRDLKMGCNNGSGGGFFSKVKQLAWECVRVCTRKRLCKVFFCFSTYPCGILETQKLCPRTYFTHHQ